MTLYVFPDIHGQYDKIVAGLNAAGFSYTNGAWRHPSAKALFLGDLIDRGTQNGDVINTVRAMQDAGQADIIMGNHEFNAILYHEDGPDGNGLRKRTEKNTHQHAAFLAEFPLKWGQTKAVIDWFMTLPLWIDHNDWRAVHACWDTRSIELFSLVSGPTLTRQYLEEAAQEDMPVGRSACLLLKGPELPLPEPHRLYDKDGTERDKARLRWWNPNPNSWVDGTISVFDPENLPTTPFPENRYAYKDEKPLFFGHYWLDGTPTLTHPSALCLDYSAGGSGPMTVYRHEGGPLTLSNLIQV